MNITVIQMTPSPYAMAIFASLIAGFVCAGVIMVRNKIPGIIVFLSLLINSALTLYFGILFSVLTTLASKHRFELGLSSAGGAIGILVGTVLIYLICQNKNYPLLKGYALSLALMYSVSKVGCFLSGCCSGREYHGFGCVTYHGEGAHIHPYPVFPVPLLETIVFFIIFMVFAILFKRVKTTTMLIVYAVAKFATDFLRESHEGVILSVNQGFCLLIAVLCIVYICIEPKLKFTKKELPD